MSNVPMPPLSMAIDYANGLRTCADCFADRAAIVLVDRIRELEQMLINFNAARAIEMAESATMRRALLDIYESETARAAMRVVKQQEAL